MPSVERRVPSAKCRVKQGTADAEANADDDADAVALTSLDLSGSLLPDWKAVVEIVECLPALKELNLKCVAARSLPSSHSTARG